MRRRNLESAIRNPKSAMEMAAHPGFDTILTVGIEIGGSKQVTYGARRLALTVATFRSWRGSRLTVAWVPLLIAPCLAQHHKGGPQPGSSAPLKRMVDTGHRWLPA